MRYHAMRRASVEETPVTKRSRAATLTAIFVLIALSIVFQPIPCVDCPYCVDGTTIRGTTGFGDPLGPCTECSGSGAVNVFQALLSAGVDIEPAVEAELARQGRPR